MTLLRPKSSQSRTIESVTRSVDSLDELDELHSESLRSEVQDLPPREQLIEAGFARNGCGETRYAGRKYKLLLVANPKGGVGRVHLPSSSLLSRDLINSSSEIWILNNLLAWHIVQCSERR